MQMSFVYGLSGFKDIHNFIVLQGVSRKCVGRKGSHGHGQKLGSLIFGS